MVALHLGTSLNGFNISTRWLLSHVQCRFPIVKRTYTQIARTNSSHIYQSAHIRWITNPINTPVKQRAYSSLTSRNNTKDGIWLGIEHKSNLTIGQSSAHRRVWASVTGSRSYATVTDENILGENEGEKGAPPSKEANGEQRLAERKIFLGSLKERYDKMNKERALDAEKEAQSSSNSRFSKMWTYLKDGFHHTVDGFKLLATNVRITAGILRKLNKGEDLLRREQRLLMMTTVDLIRVVPFSFFIIVPGGELLLPIALKLFPQMLPSTFDEKFPEDEHFSEMPDRLRHKRMLALHLCEEANLMHCPMGEVKDALTRVKRGSSLTVDDIRLVAPLVKGRIALSKLEPNLIHSIAVLLECKTTGSRDAMANRIQKKLAVLKYDDKMIYAEGIEEMTRVELVVANRRRALRHALVSTEALEQQLEWWIKLSLDPQVPNLLLMFMAPNAKPSIEKSRVMYADTAIYTTLDKLFANKDNASKLSELSSHVPKSFLTQVQMLLDQSDRDIIAARQHDKASLKDKLEAIREEEMLVKVERAEEKKEKREKKKVIVEETTEI